MSKPNLKSQAKRKRELAKLGKRQAKDEKRALRKAERATKNPELLGSGFLEKIRR